MHVTITNVSAHQAQAWVFCGMPKGRLPRDNGWLTDGVFKYPYTVDASGRGIRVLATVPADRSIKLEFMPLEERKREEFQWHPAVTRDIESVVPRFWIAGKTGDMTLVGAAFGDAAATYHMRHFFPDYKVSVDVWCTVFSGLSSVDFVAHATYGTTENNGQAQSVLLPALSMTCGLPVSVDFAVRNGNSVSAIGGQSVVNITNDNQRWHRASTFELRGAIHAAPNPARASGYQMYGLFSHWDGVWMAIGQVPKPTQATQGLRAQQFTSYKQQQFVGYAAPRPRCQPRESGTTGEQPDFGAASDLAVTMQMPWEIHDALWQCQSYVQRPVNNRERDGTPMQAAYHPQAETVNQRPDLSFGLQDRLGWPGQNLIGWIPSANTVLWTTADDQHRSDNFLHATIALTADPALEQLVRAHVQLDKTDVHIKRGLNQSPRAVGRLALARANQMWLGLADDSTLVIGIETALRLSSMAGLPAEKPVRIFGGYEQAKYGWVSSQGQPVIGWQPWQETIAAIGVLAASRQLFAAGKDELAAKYHDVAMSLARVIDANAWQRITQPGGASTDSWFHAYAIRWNNGDAFSLADWPALQSYNETWNDNVYVSTACSPWTRAASQMLDMFSALPSTPAEARWWAV
jgi:hypothetical protein